MPRTKRMGQSSATPLRKDASTADPTPEQEQALAAFLAACVIGGAGIYCTRYVQSGAIKLRLYVDGDAYEDVLNASDDWLYLFDDYSRQAGVKPHYQAILSSIWAGRAERAAEAPEPAPPAADPGAKGSRPLRGS